jgi:hypothetical protein
LRRADFVALCVSASLAACAPPEEVGGDPANPGALDEAGFETLAQGASFEPGCLASRDDRLIRTPSDWQAYWGQVHRNPVPPPPAVDFSRQSVLATCGYRPDPGHSSAKPQTH